MQGCISPDTDPEEARVAKHNDDEDNVDTVINLVSDRSDHDQVDFVDDDDDDLASNPDQPCDK